MDWINSIFTEQTFTQAILVLCIICAVGLALSRIRLWGISLGVTFVFFTGILAPRILVLCCISTLSGSRSDPDSSHLSNKVG